MVSRVLRDLGQRTSSEIVVLNDEAHHCYQDKPLEHRRRERRQGGPGAATRTRASGSGACRRSQSKVGIKQIYDLSATPFYLKGSGYNEGFIFPWTVSDFSLMDAIESGIVKVPRTPSTTTPTDELVTYLRPVGLRRRRSCPKRAAKDDGRPDWLPPDGARRRAAQPATAATRRRSGTGRQSLRRYGETPPVFIVVCPNTVVSKLVYDWIAGDRGRADGDDRRPQARQPRAAQQRRRRPAARAAADDPHRLGAARVRRGA